MATIILHPGDHLLTPRGLYNHHGIYAGHNTVVEFGDSQLHSDDVRVTAVTLLAFAQGHPIQPVHSPRCFAHTEVVQRACCWLDHCFRGPYDPLFNNCEHFANWCRSGHSISQQPLKAVGQVSAGHLARAVALSLPLEGPVPGLSQALLSSLLHRPTRP